MICNLIEFKLSCKINQIEKNENVKNYCFKNMLYGLLTKKKLIQQFIRFQDNT